MALRLRQGMRMGYTILHMVLIVSHAAAGIAHSLYLPAAQPPLGSHSLRTAARHVAVTRVRIPLGCSFAICEVFLDPDAYGCNWGVRFEFIYIYASMELY